jgi:rhodanese-related sulfurtransferase
MKPGYFLIAALLFFFTGVSANAQSINEIYAAEAGQMLKKNSLLIVLDVRTAGEYAQGHIKNALNIDANQPDVKDKLGRLDKNATYLIYCRTRNRSGVVANYMVKNGFLSVYQVVDGISGLTQQNLLVTN